MCFLCWKFFMLQNLLFRKVFYAINPFTLKTQNLLFSNVFYAIRPLKQCNLPYTTDRHAARVPGLVFPASSAGVSFGVKKGRLFERSEFLPFSRRKHRSSRKNAALILSFWFFFFRIKTKEKEYSANYSANIGSQAGSRIGFCFNTSRAFFDAYFVSTTRRNIYSLNQSSVIMR